MSILDEDLFEKCDYQIVKHNLTSINEVDIPALIQAWRDTFGSHMCGQCPPYMIKLLQLYRDELGVPYKVHRYNNGPIYIANYRIDKPQINSWLYDEDFLKGSAFSMGDNFNTFCVGCLNISWTVISSYEQGKYMKEYIIDCPGAGTPFGNVVVVQSKYDFFIQQIERVIDMIKKGIL